MEAGECGKRLTASKATGATGVPVSRGQELHRLGAVA